MATPHEQQMKILEGKIGALAVQINRCQAMVFAIFHAALNTDIGRSEAIFFCLRSDATQRDVTASETKTALFISPEYQALSAEISRELDSFNQLSGRRNDFIHAIWVDDEESGHPTVLFDIKSRLKGEDPVAVADKLLSELGGLLEKLGALADRTKAAIVHQEQLIPLYRQLREAGRSRQPPQQPQPTPSSAEDGPPDKAGRSSPPLRSSNK